MWYRIRDFFVPHHGNDHRPHLFHERSVAVLLVILVILLVSSIGATVSVIRSGLVAAIYPSVLVDLANESREERGVSSLVRDPKLTRAAELKAEHMDEHDYFAHFSPTGVTPWHWFEEADYQFVYAGENLAVDFVDSRPVNRAWMDSPKHRDNILSDQFNEIGIAVHRGTLNGRTTTFVVQMFGTAVARAADTDTSVSVVDAGSRQRGANERAEDTPVAVGDVDGAQSEDTSTSTASSSTDTAPQATSSDDRVEVVHSDSSFIAAQRVDASTTPVSSVSERDSTSWFTGSLKRLVMNPARVFSVIFAVIAAFLIAVLSAMVMVEIRKQHPRHIAYGALLLVVSVSFLSMNQVLSTLLFTWLL